MTGKKGTFWYGRVFIIALNEVDRDEDFVNAICVRSNRENELGENYGFHSNDMRKFEPYRGQIIIHSEQLNPNLN